MEEDEDPTHCYRVRCVEPRTGEEFTGFLRGQFGPPCVQCGDVSEALCDFPIGEEGRTCDRTLCLRCAPEVGVDKNYCAEHAAHGPGLILFPRPDTAVQDGIRILVTEADSAPKRARRLPRRPPPERSWHVITADGVYPWESELEARRHARRIGEGAQVEDWDRYVVRWRKAFPLKKRTRPRRT